MGDLREIGCLALSGKGACEEAGKDKRCTFAACRSRLALSREEREGEGQQKPEGQGAWKEERERNWIGEERQRERPIRVEAREGKQRGG